MITMMLLLLINMASLKSGTDAFWNYEGLQASRKRHYRAELLIKFTCFALSTLQIFMIMMRWLLLMMMMVSLLIPLANPTSCEPSISRLFTSGRVWKLPIHRRLSCLTQVTYERGGDIWGFEKVGIAKDSPPTWLGQNPNFFSKVGNG